MYAEGLASCLPPEIRGQMAAYASLTPPGALVEVGVWRGGSAMALYMIAKAQARELHLFDTFTGIPERTPQYDHHEVGDFKDTDVEAIRRAMPDASLHIGVFPQTLPPHVKDIAFVHADADQYESTKAIIKELGARMVPGGIMVFDDMDHAGVQKAIAECLPEVKPLDIGWNRALVTF